MTQPDEATGAEPVRMGAFLRDMRESRGLTQEELAKLIGRKPPMVHRYESGKSYIPTEMISVVARALGWPVDVFALALFGFSANRDSLREGAIQAEMPLGARVAIQEALLELARAGASDEQLEAARRLLSSGDPYVLYYGKALQLLPDQAVVEAVRRVGASLQRAFTETSDSSNHESD